MKISDLQGPIQTLSSPTNNSFSIDQRQPMSPMESATTALSTSQAALDKSKWVSPGSPESRIPTNSGQNLIDLGKGALQSVGNTVMGAATLGENVANQTAGRVVNAVQGNGFTPLNDKQLGGSLINPHDPVTQDINKTFTPQNSTQGLGNFLGSVAQAAIPLGKASQGIEAGSIIGKALSPLKEFLANRATTKAVNAIAPKLTSGEIEASPNVIRPKIGAPRVDFTKDTALQQIANDTKDIAKGKSSIDDKNALKSAIEQTSVNGVKPFLAENKVPANFEDLQKKLSLVHPQSSLKADPSALKTYSRVREEVQTSLYNSLKETAKAKGDFTGNVDFNDVWDARKVLDSKAEEELGSKVFGTPEFTGAKAAIQDMRQGLTQYIKDSLQFPGQMEDVNRMQEFTQVAKARGIEIGSKEAQALMEQMGIKSTPEGIARAKTFEDSMSKISNFYKAIDNVSTKIPEEIRLNSTFGKRHPILKRVAQGLGIGGGIGIEEEVRKRI